MSTKLSINYFPRLKKALHVFPAKSHSACQTMEGKPGSGIATDGRFRDVKDCSHFFSCQKLGCHISPLARKRNRMLFLVYVSRRLGSLFFAKDAHALERPASPAIADWWNLWYSHQAMNFSAISESVKLSILL